MRYLLCAFFTTLCLTGWSVIEIAPVPGFNLTIIDQPTANVVVVQPSPKLHNWFAGKFINLPVGQSVEIRVDMHGCDTPGNVADTAKWAGLQPVFTYADPEQYASYEWFRKDAAGTWQSGDLFKHGDDRQAGAGITPAQSAVPATLAGLSLAADGQYWSPWGEIDGGTNNTDTRTFTFTVRPAQATMTIAMHLPYLLAYEQAMIARLQAAHFPGVFVDELGRSAGGRMLYMIRVDDPDAPAALHIDPTGTPVLDTMQPGNRGVAITASHPTIHLAAEPGRPWGDRRLYLLDAREHASEHTGSWLVFGALRALLAETPAARRLRHKSTWLLLPVFDPDGVAASQYDPRTECTIAFNDQDATPEALDYVHYLRAFPNAGWAFVAAATFYALECTDGKPVCCPYAWSIDRDTAIDFNRHWFARLNAAGIPAGPVEPWSTGWLPNRLVSGCTAHYKALSFFFEVNDRFPDARMTLDRLQQIGADFPAALADWSTTPTGAAALAASFAQQRKRLDDGEKRQSQSEASGRLPDQPTLYEMMTLGE